MSAKEIFIVHETVAQSVIKDVVLTGCLSAAIGVGLIIKSDALQWIAGFVWVLLVLSASIKYVNGTGPLTIAKARARLAQLEQENEDK